MDPRLTFVIGGALLLMFLWYFATDSARRKRAIGTVLALGITALTIYYYETLGIKKGIEIQGGIAITMRLAPGDERPVDAEAQQMAVSVLQKRLDALGTREVMLAPQGADRLFIQIPGVEEKDVPAIEETLKKIARLEISIVHPQSYDLAPQVAAGETVVPGWRAIPAVLEEDKDGAEAADADVRSYFLVKRRPDLSGAHVTSASVIHGPTGPEINVGFDSDGAKVLGALTTAHRGELLAIILDGEVLSAPVINEPFSSGCRITGEFDQESAARLASALENPLENPIEVVQRTRISPSMGAETVRQGVLAGVAGLAATLVFILAYYRLAGLVALLGLAVNLAIVFGTMALFGFTLTLPGIAGIILTIGIAIDSNVLIYERLREELAAGKSLSASIRGAYDKAFSAIFDANLTTLITAVILFLIATGTVRGFAITLTIGVIASMFSALLVTRTCFAWATSLRFFKKLRFLQLVPESRFDFLRKRRPCLIASAVLVAVSLTALVVLDPRGVDLRGGDILTIRDPGGLTTEAIENSLADAGLEKSPAVQSLRPLGAEGELFTIRSEVQTGEQVKAELEKDLGVSLAHSEVESFGSQVGNEMLRSSGIALGLGLFAILIYVTVRFEFSFALGALVALVHDLVVTVGLLTLMGYEITLITVGALLTIAGYSINDTVVVFDRVREGLRNRRGEVRDIMNHSLNATLSRTVLTGLTTLLTVLTLFLFGGVALRNFALAIMIGVLVGTYSSVFVASPVVLWWTRRAGVNLRRQVIESDQNKLGPGAAGAPAAP